MAVSSSSPSPPAPDQDLPPVQPPSAGFILQLFIVPGVIVTIIVLVWLLFNYLAQMGNDPQSYVKALERGGEQRWQAAVNLANALAESKTRSGDDSQSNIKLDASVENHLATLLDSEITLGQMSEKPVMLRIFLCRALGEFYLADSLPVLLRAANTQRDEAEGDVRLAAVEAIAVLAENMRRVQHQELAATDLLPTVIKASQDEHNKLLRSHAAFTLGVLGGDEALTRLRQMLDDEYPDARFNAATALARNGDGSCIEVLVDMLDPEQELGVKSETEKDLKAHKRAVIHASALEATRQLLEKNDKADLKPLADAVRALIAANPDNQIGEVKVATADLLKKLDTRTTTGHSAAEAEKIPAK